MRSSHLTLAYDFVPNRAMTLTRHMILHFCDVNDGAELVAMHHQSSHNEQIKSAIVCIKSPYSTAE